jgi:hypothetical protein
MEASYIIAEAISNAAVGLGICIIFHGFITS